MTVAAVAIGVIKIIISKLTLTYHCPTYKLR